VAASVVVAWLLVLAGELSGAGRVLHHNEVLGETFPAWTGVGLFLAGWVVMCAAMMLPAAVPVLVRGDRTAAGTVGAGASYAFVAGFLLVWAGFGAVALALDTGVHRLVDSVPTLADRPSLVTAGLLALAGAAQLRLSGRSLAAVDRSRSVPGASPAVAFRAGRHHGVACLGCDGPLMLVMFAAAGSLLWMAVLTLVMTAQRLAAAGPPLASATGGALLVWAALIGLGSTSLPSPFVGG
jgi:predicted metal-binding membrane protein